VAAPARAGRVANARSVAADDAAELEDILSSMPLRVWRTDEVLPLSPHPSDPGAASS